MRIESTTMNSEPHVRSHAYDEARLRGRSRATTIWRVRFEKLAWGVGLLLVAGYAAGQVHRAVSSRTDVQKFYEARKAVQAGAALLAVDVGDEIALLLPHADFELWSDSRIQHYRESLSADLAAPMALLRIPSIELEVPILEGVDEVTLNRAIGRIGGTAQLGEVGNMGLAGHRDGFFRSLKDIQVGDVIHLDTLSDTYRYVVDDLSIITPDEISVLGPTSEQTLTLVTCYPFYFVGSAPQRFIVRATLLPDRDDPAHSS